jgi:hypothetical protein
MLDQLGGVARGLDTRLRGRAALASMDAERRRRAAIIDDLSSRMQAAEPDIGGVEQKIRNYIGGEEGEYKKILASRAKRSEPARQALYEQAAAASKPGLVEQYMDRMAGVGNVDRAVQVGTYGAIGGGVVMGLTPVGQGLEALRQFIQSANQQEEAREYPLS